MSRLRSFFRVSAALICAALLPWAGLADSFQQIPAQAPAQNRAPQFLSADQLDTLVAPIALYPDPLLGQILAASTYPLEIVEAQQWIQRNSNLQGQALIEAARQQDWDPSVQVLVAFPDVVELLNRDIRWTTDLGNAFLAQQADLMNAIQTLRFQAKNNGRLASTPQQTVVTDSQNGQYAVRIEPANPQVIYPPIYNPVYVWGPPAWGTYPAVSYYSSAPYYPGAYGGGGYGSGGFGYGFGSGINIAGIFSGLLNWGSWGWALGWFTHSLSLVSLFFNLLGFHGFGGGYGSGGVYGAGAAAITVWAHNPAHRLGVPYPGGFVVPHGSGALASARPGSSRLVASTSGTSAARILGSSVSGSPRSNPGVARPGASEWHGFGNGIGANTRPGVTSSGNYGQGAAQSYRGAQNTAPQRSAEGFQGAAYKNAARSAASYPSPRYMAANSQQQHFSEPKYSAPKYSAPRISTPKFSAPKAPKAQHFSAPKNSGGGHSGKSSHKH